jgi:uncharacterized protein with GYD domain
MLFMTIYTYSPENRDAVIKRRVEKGGLLPPGVKAVGEWSSTSGHKVFRIIDADDPKALMAATVAWSDLGNIESYSILPMDEVLKVLAARK